MTEIMEKISSDNSKVSDVMEKIFNSGNNFVGNNIRRKLYSHIELLRLDLEKLVLDSKIDDNAARESLNIMDTLISKLDLVPVTRPIQWWHPIDYAFRAIGVSMGLATFGTFCALPMILLRPVDIFLVQNKIITPDMQASEWLKRSICRVLLSMAGVHVVVEGLSPKTFNNSCCSLLTFSHSCNLDGILLSAYCPIRHLALAKKELFMVPFFSWISFAMGGIPVDREHRGRAVHALKRSAEVASNENICVVIAPEGTRSKTGQLLPFKKGAFYLAEELKCPIVPFVIIGGYDLYPVNTWVNVPGRVYVRFLDPILPSEASSREENCRLVRKRMLDSFADVPDDICEELTWSDRFESVFSIISLLCVDLILLKLITSVFIEHFQFTMWEVLILVTSGSILITILLYLYNVYVVNMSASTTSSSSSSSRYNSNSADISKQIISGDRLKDKRKIRLGGGRSVSLYAQLF